MKKLFAAAAVLLAATLCPSWAETPAGECPWVKAQTVLDAAFPDIKAGGIRAMSSHSDDFEKALADRARACGQTGDADIILLTDGQMETMVVLAAAQKALPGKKIVTVNDPYPPLALFLGSYYNEIGRYEDALRVLEAENAANQGTMGDTRAALTSERAVALGQLHRLPEALAVYEAGLKLDNIDDKGKARMHRGRGFILTELDRLDEAETAYNESLKFEPGNTVAEHELEYIYKLKLGGAKVPMSKPVLPGDVPKKN